VSRDSILDRHFLPATDWRQRYLPCCMSTGVRSRAKLGEVSCTGCTSHGNDFELIPTIKMETRHPEERSFGNEFPSIYNYCGVMAAWSRKTLKKFHFFSFLNDMLRKKFWKFCSKRIHRHSDRRVVFKFREIWPTEMGKIVCCLSDKNFVWLSIQLSLLRGSRPKSARVSPRQCTQITSDFI